MRSNVREMVLFATHDLLKDAPFSRLDLLTCRNLLIYLNRDAQARAFDIFHFSLRLNGLLFLGSAEFVGEASVLFSSVGDKKHRLFRHQQPPRKDLSLPNASTLARTLAARTQAGPTIPQELANEPSPAPPDTEPLANRSLSELHYQLIEKVATPSVLINAQHEIVHLSPGAGEFLQFVGGAPTDDLLRLVHPMLRLELRAALLRATQSQALVEVHDLAVDDHGVVSLIDIRIQPGFDLSPGYLLVLFAKRSSPSGLSAVPPAREIEPVALQLECELDRMKAHVLEMSEYYESSAEELKSRNEELQAMNEELRSATEELETSREESQSTNEELNTVNLELKSKVDELAHANSDLHNLMGASAIATVFLDRNLRITRYTPVAVEIFSLLPGDIGRPLFDLTHRLVYPELEHDAAIVLAQLVPLERQVSDSDGRWYLARGRPYRTVNDHIAGVVLTFVEVTEARANQEALERSRNALVNALADNEAARAELVAASRAKDQFLAILSYELRTPLTPVVMALQVLAMRKDLPAPVLPTLELIRRNVRIEAHMIDDLLDLTHVSRGTFEVARESMDLHAAIRGAIEISEPDLQAKGQQLDVALEATEFHLSGDFARLQQAIWNLLKNASKFTPVGGRVSISTRSEVGRVFIVIKDTGIGIEADLLPLIFDAFRQGGEWVAREFGGLGLGLAIANATVKTHDGVVRAESLGKGQGALFTIELPLI